MLSNSLITLKSFSPHGTEKSNWKLVDISATLLFIISDHLENIYLTVKYMQLSTEYFLIWFLYKKSIHTYLYTHTIYTHTYIHICIMYSKSQWRTEITFTLFLDLRTIFSQNTVEIVHSVFISL